MTSDAARADLFAAGPDDIDRIDGEEPYDGDEEDEDEREDEERVTDEQEEEEVTHGRGRTR